MSELILLLCLLAALCIWDWINTSLMMRKGMHRHFELCMDLENALVGTNVVESRAYHLLREGQSAWQDGFRLSLFVIPQDDDGSEFRLPVISVSKSGPVAYYYVRPNNDEPEMCWGAFYLNRCDDIASYMLSKMRECIDHLHSIRIASGD